MGFLKRQKQDRWVTTKKDTFCVHGYEYVYSVTKQGLGNYVYHTSGKFREISDAINLADPAFQSLLQKIPEQNRAPLIELYRRANPSAAAANKRFRRRDAWKQLWDALMFVANANSGTKVNPYNDTTVMIPKETPTYKGPSHSTAFDNFVRVCRRS